MPITTFNCVSLTRSDSHLQVLILIDSALLQLNFLTIIASHGCSQLNDPAFLLQNLLNIISQTSRQLGCQPISLPNYLHY